MLDLTSDIQIKSNYTGGRKSINQGAEQKIRRKGNNYGVVIDEESGVRAKQYFACRAHKEGEKSMNCSICKLQMKNP